MKKIVVTVVLVVAFIFTVGSVYPASAAKPTVTPTSISTPTTSDASFQAFVTACTGKGENNIACIYVMNQKGEMVLKLSNLTWGDGVYLNRERGKETAQIWNKPWNDSKTIWLLAHDFADGDLFYKLHGNVTIYLIYADGTWKKFGVANQYKWYDVGTEDGQTLYSRWSDPASGKPSYKRDDFIDLYSSSGNIIFQTCMGKGTIIITKVVPITVY